MKDNGSAAFREINIERGNKEVFADSGEEMRVGDYNQIVACYATYLVGEILFEL